MPEVRLERLAPAEVGERLAMASVAFVPIGSVEYHGPHLPLGVDMVTAHGLAVEAATGVGGVVAPASYLANGCLDLPHSLTFTASLVEAWTSEMIDQLHRRGVELVVLLTGHGPLDLIHLLKRVAASHDRPGARAYGLCYLELNAARLAGPEVGEPTVIDHASTIETSWMLALEPGLVDLDTLSDDPDATTLGVYGRNPRFTATPHQGRAQLDAAADLLGARCRGILAGEWTDDLGDLNRFVELAWPEPLLVGVTSTQGEGMRAWIRNPGRASRYITSVRGVRLDGRACDTDSAYLLNVSVGETGSAFLVEDLHRENGIYVRRGQELSLVLPAATAESGPHTLELDVELGGVRSVRLLSGVGALDD